MGYEAAARAPLGDCFGLLFFPSSLVAPGLFRESAASPAFTSSSIAASSSVICEASSNSPVAGE